MTPALPPALHPVERLSRTCAAPAWRLAYALLHDADHAYDAVQQAFLAAARKPTAVPAGDAWPWFAVVVAHEARNLRRKRRPVPIGVGGGSGESARSPMSRFGDGEGYTLDPPDTRASDPAARAEALDDRRALWDAIDALPPDEREAVVLTRVAGLTQDAAAAAIAAPRQTVADRASRGLARITRRLGRGAPPAAAAFAALPTTAPPGGMEAATAAWTSGATGASGATGVAGAGIQGGTIVATTKVLWLSGIALAAGLGFVGGGAARGLGWFASDGGGPRANADGAGGSATVAPPTLRGTPDAPGSVAGDPAEAEVVRRLREDNARLGARVAVLEREASARAAESSGDAAHRGPTFTFGEMGRLDAVREADWPALAAAAKEVSGAVAEMHRLGVAGEPVPKAVQLRLQENVERVRTYEYRTVDRMPTSARFNGELTHPISATNLLAAMLAGDGHALTAEQVERIDRLGARFEEDFARVRGAWGPDTPRARRILEEMRLKGAFMDAMWGLLDAAQRPAWVDPSLRAVAGVDLFDPTLMVIHTSIVLTGADAAALRPKLLGALRPRLGLAADATLDAPVVAAADAYLARATRGLTPVAPSVVRNYTFAQAMSAGEASVELVEAILRDGALAPEARRALLDDPTWYVPRLVTP